MIRLEDRIAQRRMVPGGRWLMPVGLLFAHMHDAGHERMDGADVVKIAFASKGMLEFVVGIQPLRSKTLVVAGYGMRRFVAIGPRSIVGAGAPADAKSAGIKKAANNTSAKTAKPRDRRLLLRKET